MAVPASNPPSLAGEPKGGGDDTKSEKDIKSKKSAELGFENGAATRTSSRGVKGLATTSSTLKQDTKKQKTV